MFSFYDAFDWSRNVKRALMLVFDLALIPTSLVTSYFLLTHHLDFGSLKQLSLVVPVQALLTVAVFLKLGLYRAVIRYMSLDLILATLKGVVLTSVVAYLMLRILDFPHASSVAIIYGLILALSVSSSRLFIRHSYLNYINPQKNRILIYGGGSAGLQLLTALGSSDKYRPVAIVDDNEEVQGTVIHGLDVFKSEEIPKLVNSHRIDQILLALPSLSRAKRKEILESLEELPVRVRTIPGMADLVSGKAEIQEIRDVGVEDLLGRDPVEPVYPLLEKCIKNKTVLVSGAGGSIGSELCRQILGESPIHLIIIDSCEFGLYQIEKELADSARAAEQKTRITPFLMSVLDKERINEIIETYHVDTIYHAAAYKHVPMVEHNIIAGVRNNVFGTLYLAEAALKNSVETFVLISTDKAVRPTNVMGASKRLSELILQGLAQVSKNTVFCMVRFGNVLGSSGSVVPLFKRQIQDGGPITVTHPEIIRYFMTISEASQLVIQAGALAKGGEVFVLDMGEPVKIADLARKMVRLMGMEVKCEENPHGDIEIKFTGLRPGEKLYEELLIGDNPSGTDHARIMCAEEVTLPWESVQLLLKELEKACEEFDCHKLRKLLMNSEADYAPNTEMVDFLWCEQQMQKEKQERAKGNVVSVFGPNKEKTGS